MNVAVIGLGTMGAPMARNLLKAGHTLSVHNRTRERERPLEEAGALRCETPAAAAKGADVVLLCVSDTPDVEAIVEADGVGVFCGLRAGALVVDCSTISPEATRRLAAEARRRGAGWVDAPVSGGSEGAINGTLAVMCGGDPTDFERARPVLEAIGKAITLVGPSGAGQVAKAVNQVVISGVYQAVAEGLCLATGAGVDPQRVLAAIENGAASSWVLTQRGPNMIADEYPLGFRMRLHRKDLGIALDSARATGVHLPVASYVATTEDALIGRGFGDEDMSALAREVRTSSGLPPGPMRPREAAEG